MTQKLRKLAEAGFAEIAVRDRYAASLHVSFQKADYKHTMKMLFDHDLEPLTRSMALRFLTSDDAFRDLVEGKWFWLAGEGLEESGYYTLERRGGLVRLDEATRRKTSPEMVIDVRPGKGPISVGVAGGYTFGYYDSRFTMGADVNPSGEATAVLGFRRKPDLKTLRRSNGVKDIAA
ncbi:MAG: hypothetical protein KGH72_04135 [Candidatus Micrarchaeota archaeon]|nr:hypothetical protein [Candidatus Micrarchaeota archaeon]